MNNQNDIFEFLRGLASRGFFGSVELNFQNGKVTHLRQEINLKPTDLIPGTRTSDDDKSLNR